MLWLTAIVIPLLACSSAGLYFLGRPPVARQLRIPLINVWRGQPFKSFQLTDSAAYLYAPKSVLKKHVVIFEVEGGSDKGRDGHRPDTMPLVAALQARGWNAEVIMYSDAARHDILDYVAAKADGFISRVNPGTYPGYTESLYFEMCRELSGRGLIALSHPDTMLNFGAKDALVKLAHTPSGMPDTFAYYDADTFRLMFPLTIATSDRVLKQNRGSTGNGIWVVRPHGWERGRGANITADTLLECTEMVDNHVEVLRLADLLDRCEKYITEDSGQLVDQRFLPRIVEGEIRVLMVGDKPVAIVHKKPANGHMSATLFSGAQYTYDRPDDPKWSALVQSWLKGIPSVWQTLGQSLELPLLWTADFILDTSQDGGDSYKLGDMNCSCVGFSTQLELAGVIADTVIGMVSERKLGSYGEYTPSPDLCDLVCATC